MRRLASTTSISILGLLLTSGCGEDQAKPAVAVAVVQGTGTSVSTPSPTPSPTPTATPTPVPTPSPSPLPTDSAVPRKVLVDNQFYGAGQFLAYAAPWCALHDSSLKVGIDLVDTISFPVAAFPAAVEITSAAPAENPNLHGCGVYGYHFVAYGNYNNGAPPVDVTPRQVGSITSFKESFTWHPRSGGPDNYNILNEFYVTSSAGGYSAQVAEIGVMLHASASAVTFARLGTPVGTWTDASGRAWTITQQPNKYVMVLPADGKDVLSGELDFGSLLRFLMARGVLTGNEWVNGAAIGLENVSGNSAVTIDSWSISLS